MGTLRFFEEVVSFKIRRTFGFADYTGSYFRNPEILFTFVGKNRRDGDSCGRACTIPACKN